MAQQDQRLVDYGWGELRVGLPGTAERACTVSAEPPCQSASAAYLLSRLLELGDICQDSTKRREAPRPIQLVRPMEPLARMAGTSSGMGGMATEPDHHHYLD